LNKHIDTRESEGEWSKKAYYFWRRLGAKEKAFSKNFVFYWI